MHSLIGIFVVAALLAVVVGGPILLIWYIIKIFRRDRAVAALPKLKTGETSEKNYFYYANPKSRGRQVNGVGINTGIAFSFRFEPLDSFDKLAAMLGFANPAATGDPVFDTQVYTYSTNPFFYQALSSNAVLRKTVLDIFHKGFTSIFCDNGQLVACGGRGSAIFGRWKVDEQPAEELSAQLHDCQHSLATVQADANDTSLQRAAAFDKRLRSILSIALVVGIFAVIFCTANINYQLLETLPLLKLTATCAAPVIIAALFLLRPLVSDTPYGADAFKAFIQMGVMTIAIWSFSGLYFANIHFDEQQPSTYWQRIIGKHYTTGRHGSHSYYLSVEGWRNAEKVNLKVALSVYNAMNPGQNMQIISHPGYFNIEWISLK